VAKEVLPAYVDGLMEHWRESAEADEERELFARIDRGETVPPEEIARDRLVYGSPDQVTEQILRYRAETGAEHVHLAFGSGLPGGSTSGYYGTFEQHLEMVTLFGREVLPTLAAL
jgi:alkanesulfonate monooxygenase SsuD/methylene tetrahydromethanopterin reductase-like flavin-dependent oxidoreductase (luciferase family)